ncbi:MAG TPA: succinate dehydrogenase assembly factor 2 family protein [Chromatiales bacterium]|nr:succinate dehydrogenase assembly factor 2 family protein [Chromatiales bacterium]
MSTAQPSGRLRWHCRRGMRELDVLLMGYLDRHYAHVPEAEQQAFERLLGLQDPEILGLLNGRIHAQDAALNDVVQRLLAVS